MSSRLKTKIWVEALVRRAQIGGASAYIMHKGDPDAGITFIKVSTLNGEARLYFPTRNLDGVLSFSASESQFESQIDARFKKQRQFDSDLWLIEIEDKAGRHFLTEEILTPHL